MINQDAEALAIGTALTYQEVLEDFFKLEEADFFGERNKKIYNKIKEIYKEKGEVELADLAGDEISINTIIEYCNLAYSATALKPTIDKLKEASRRRSLLHLASMLQEKANNPAEDVEELLKVSYEYIEQSSNEANKEPELLFDVAERRINSYIEGITERGITTDLIDLDETFAGLFRQELTVLAGRPSMGKTALSQYIALKVAQKTQEAVTYFSLEMGNEALADRYIANSLSIDVDNLRRGYVKKETIEEGSQKIAKDLSSYLYIHDDSNVTTFDIMQISRKIKRRKGLSLIVIDFLTLLADEKERGESEHLKVSAIVRRLRDIAQKLDVPVLVLAQLNRNVENKDNKRPRKSDLRESGGIEEGADNVLLLYRDEYYYKDKSDKPGVMEVIVDKQKQGPAGVIAEIGYEASTGKFYNISKQKEV